MADIPGYSDFREDQDVWAQAILGDEQQIAQPVERLQRIDPQRHGNAVWRCEKLWKRKAGFVLERMGNRILEVEMRDISRNLRSLERKIAL